MRFPTALAALALLAACATAPASAPTVQTSGEAPASVQTSRAMQLLQSAGRADAPSQGMLRRELGDPDIVRQEGAGAAWTYRLETCALLLLFSADARNEMRLAEVNPSARQASAAAPSLEQCAAEASARRS